MDTRRQSGLWDQNSQGVYERKSVPGPYQYYQHPTTSQRRRSYSERAAEAGDVSTDAIKAATQSGLERSTSGRKQQSRSANAQAMSAQHPQTYYDDADEDVPENLRSKAWSPEPAPPMSSTTRTNAPPLRHASNASEHIRRGSVPDRSPLQTLEAKFDNISKEEKRARLEEAERHARKSSLGENEIARSMPLRNGKGRVVSSGSRTANEGIRRDQRESSGSMVESPTLPQEEGKRKFRRASDALKNETAGRNIQNNHPASPTDSQPMSPKTTHNPERFPTSQRTSTSTRDETVGTGLGRSESQKYRHRARDAGFAGAAAAIAGSAVQESAAARGRAAHERRKSQISSIQQSAQPRTSQQTAISQPPVRQPSSRETPLPQSLAQQTSSQQTSLPQSRAHQSSGQPLASPGVIAVPDNNWGPAHAPVPSSPRGKQFGGTDRPRSKRLQKAPPSSSQYRSQLDGDSARRQSSDSRGSVDSDRRLLHSERVGTEHGKPDTSVAPREPDIISKEQASTGQEHAVPYQIPPQTAAARQAKDKVTFAPDVADPEEQGHHLFGAHHTPARAYKSNAEALEEWRNAEVARLSAAQIALDEGQATAGAERGAAWWERPESGRPSTAATRDEPYEEQATSFNPPLFLKCGPLLRFTGLQRSHKTGQGTHAWRGSVMIVTDDIKAKPATPPVLRLFTQPMDLYRRPPHESQETSKHDEYDDHDPVTGQMKISRIGRPIYVRPVHSLRHGVDLSRQENNTGLFSAEPPTTLGAQHSINAQQHQQQHVTSRIHSRVRQRDGEKLGQYVDIRAHRLHVEHNCTFWRFNLEVELGTKPARIAYRINNGPAIGFWVPARGETMNIMFHSCNGFSLSVDSAEFCGPDPLWRDVLNRHQSKPFHVMIGGGDQIYNDAAVRDTTHFKEWLQLKNHEHKYHADFTEEMQEELETFYFTRYAMWFSQGFFSMANAQIPMVNIYDDHDIIDGFGSYPHHFMRSPVFTGLGAIAFKYYMLFQHQSLPTETTKEEPSWLLGASPGPYIHQLNRSIFVWLGEKVALLALDCRTERMRDEILSLESYDIIFDRCRHELVAGDTKHLIVLLGVPIAYPRLNFLENILTSRVMDPIKAVGRTGALGGFVNKFDGGVEILDDLDDHWTAKHHKKERNWFVQELQDLAAEKSVRVTILGGDVHLGAVSQFYSNKKLRIPKDKDHRYMPNVISSAIVNTPPPPMMADVLNRRNKIHHLDSNTDEDMIPMFSHDVDGSKRSNKHLLPRRNFAMIREYMPGSTPPSTPTHSKPDINAEYAQLGATDDRRYPPGSMGRSMSLGKGPSRLMRRLSLRGRNPPLSYGSNNDSRPMSFHEEPTAAQSGAIQSSNNMSDSSRPQRPSLSFQRRPTNLSLKEARLAAAKGGPHDEGDEDNLPGHINLEHGLDITLCMEVDQHDPAGHTEPYRLLVPALRYGRTDGEDNSMLPARRPSLFQRLTGGRQARQANDYDDEQDYEDSPSASQASITQDDVAPSATINRRAELEELQATAAGAGGTHGNTQPTRSVYHQKGYDLGSPPLGNSTSKQLGQPQSDNPQFNAHQSHYDDRADDDQSMTVSEVDTSGTPVPDQRRLSKAERFFGFGGNERGPQSSDQGLARRPSEAGTKRRSIWTPWKAGSGMKS